MQLYSVYMRTGAAQKRPSCSGLASCPFQCTLVERRPTATIRRSTPVPDLVCDQGQNRLPLIVTSPFLQRNTGISQLALGKCHLSSIRACDGRVALSWPSHCFLSDSQERRLPADPTHDNVLVRLSN